MAAVAAAIDATGRPEKHRDFDPPQQRFLDSVQSVLTGSLELLESGFFLLLRAAVLNISWLSVSKGTSGFMIVCSCNVLSDDDVRNAVNSRKTFRAMPSRSTAASVAAPNAAAARAPSRPSSMRRLAPAPRPAVPDARTAGRKRISTETPSSRSPRPDQSRISPFRREVLLRKGCSCVQSDLETF